LYKDCLISLKVEGGILPKVLIWSCLPVLLVCKELVYIQPMNKCIKPLVAGPVRISQSKAMPAVLIQVKLYRNPGLVPRFDQAGLSVKKKIIGSNHIKHGWGIFRNFHRSHTTIDRPYKGEFHLFRI